MSLIHLLYPRGRVFPNNIRIDVTEHFRNRLGPLTNDKLSHRERVLELLAIGLLASRPSRSVKCRKLDPKHTGRFERMPIKKRPGIPIAVQL